MFSTVIVVKDIELDKYINNHTKHKFNFVKCKISGLHYDAGLTQCKEGQLLAIGIVARKDVRLNLKLY